MLVVVVAGSKSSCPTRVTPTAENAGFSESPENSTPENTPQAALLADCIRQHLPQDRYQTLLAELNRNSPAGIR
jgi:hypothetical protein